jgi:hypothetical protein
MKLSLRLILLTAVMLLPSAAMAAMENVTGVTASLVDGHVHVRWQKPAGDIAQYRVYYSHASLLQNGGKYDDFETVPGNATQYVFPTNPPVATLYVSVIAVNTQGEESPLLAQEATIQLGQGGTASAQPASRSADAQDSFIHLLTARAISATGVILNFSHTVNIDRVSALTAFDIRDASGAQLRLRRLIIDDKTVTIHTEPQVRGRLYIVRLGASLRGWVIDDMRLSIDPQQAPMFFAGSPDGIDPGTGTRSSVGSSTGQVGGGARDISGLRLTGVPDAQGTYTIEASWMNPADILGLRVAQTADNGETFWPEQQLAADTQMLRVRGVPGGTFGIRIRAVGKDNALSPGAYATLDLPKTGAEKPLPTPSRTPVGSTGLPNSGFGLAAAVILAGAGTGFWEMRRRRAQVA